MQKDYLANYITWQLSLWYSRYHEKLNTLRLKNIFQESVDFESYLMLYEVWGLELVFSFLYLNTPHLGWLEQVSLGAWWHIIEDPA